MLKLGNNTVGRNDVLGDRVGETVGRPDGRAVASKTTVGEALGTAAEESEGLSDADGDDVDGLCDGLDDTDGD